MNEKEKAFIDDLFSVLEKHGVFIDHYYDEVDFASYALDEIGARLICLDIRIIEAEFYKRLNEKETARKIEAQKLKMSKKANE